MTSIEVLFKDFLRTSPLAINNLVTIDSTVAPQWYEVFKSGYHAGIESVGDVVIQSPEDVEVLKREIANLKGQITKLKKAK